LPPEIEAIGEFIITDAIGVTEEEQVAADHEKDEHNAEIEALFGGSTADAPQPAKKRKHIHLHLE